MLYYSTHRNSFQALEDEELSVSATTMDRFDRCFSIFCLSSMTWEPGCEWKGSGGAHGWKAVRVDLVVTPYSQFSFALLGWTGSKVSMWIYLVLGWDFVRSKMFFLSLRKTRASLSFSRIVSSVIMISSSPPPLSARDLIGEQYCFPLLYRTIDAFYDLRSHFTCLRPICLVAKPISPCKDCSIPI